jgi:hypothetical protein
MPRREDHLGAAWQIEGGAVGQFMIGCTPGTRNAPAATMLLKTGTDRG